MNLTHIQINGKDLTQSEKNRLSRSIRKKLKIIKNLNQFSNEFALKKNQNNLVKIQKGVETILIDKLKDSITAILLFGSFANNTFIYNSDIDICVIFDSISNKEAAKFRIRIMGELPKIFDIQVFNTLPLKIKKNIAINHKILYSTKQFKNLDFTINLLKNENYFIRKNKIFGKT